VMNAVTKDDAAGRWRIIGWMRRRRHSFGDGDMLELSCEK
jgi:hypothetical protein